jgi:chromate transporter
MTSPPEQPKVSLLSLLAVYTKIGTLGFGGGYAVLSFIRSETVEKHAWITPQQFDQIVEMSAFSPGPTTTNVLAAIAMRLKGTKGLILGFFAVIWPSFLLILGLADATAVLHNPYLTGALRGIEVAVIGLLLDVVWTLWKDVPHLILTAAIAAMAVGLTVIGISPIITIALASVIALTDYAIRKTPLELNKPHGDTKK